MHRNLLVSIALGTYVLLAQGQTQQPISQPAPREVQPFIDALSKLPPLTPAQLEAAKAAREAARADFERRLDARFVVTGNEVYDKKTERTWQRCNFGQTWDEESRWCKGVTKRVTIDAAATEMARSGNGWRVPDAGEMMSLLEIACGDTKKKDTPASVFPEILQNTFYLTSTAHGDSEHNTAAECLGGMASTVGLGRKYVSVLRLVREGK